MIVPEGMLESLLLFPDSTSLEYLPLVGMPLAESSCFIPGMSAGGAASLLYCTTCAPGCDYTSRKSAQEQSRPVKRPLSSGKQATALKRSVHVGHMGPLSRMYGESSAAHLSPDTSEYGVAIYGFTLASVAKSAASQWNFFNPRL